MTIDYQQYANQALKKWKRDTGTLPDEARQPGMYLRRPELGPLEVCLPADYALLNLLPEAREPARLRFEEASIQWHDSTPVGPSNHLRDSQVQCLNALAPMIEDSAAIHACFGDLLDITEVLPFDPASSRPNDHIVFEWIGQKDYLGEGGGKRRQRGTKTTSADAAFRYRDASGQTAVALIEWKYTEAYEEDKELDTGRSGATRLERYSGWWNDGGPFETDVLPYQDVFVEPLYQLMRLHLLAFEMERHRELDARRVRVVYAAPATNRPLWETLLRESHKAAGRDLADVWKHILRDASTFRVFDTAELVAPGAPTSPEFKDRYGHLARS